MNCFTEKCQTRRNKETMKTGTVVSESQPSGQPESEVDSDEPELTALVPAPGRGFAQGTNSRGCESNRNPPPDLYSFQKAKIVPAFKEEDRQACEARLSPL